MLQNKVEDTYFLSEEIQERFNLTDDTFTKSIVGTTKPEFRTIGQRDLVYQKDGVMGTLVATDYKQPKQILENQEEYRNNKPNYRIRKLTPTECWRLMGFNDDDVEKSRALKMSDTALYKQAGNSIITNCISLIMEHLYKAQIDDTYICSDENFI